MKRIGIFTTHPIQYQAPLWRILAREPSVATKVYYLSDHGIVSCVDEGFGQAFAWDVPLLGGYDHEFISRVPISGVGRATIPNLSGFIARERLDAVMVHGYASAYCRQLVQHRKTGAYRLLMRGEFATNRDPGSPAWRAALRPIYLRRLYRHVDVFASIGKDSTAHLVRHGVSPDRIVVAPYSVDDALIEQQRAACDRSQERAALGIDDTTRLILFSGKLIPRKQPMLLAESIARLPSKDRVAVCFLGAGEQQDRVEATLRPILGGRLIMPGFVNQSQLGRYFAAADLFCLPSAYDTWGLVVNEAMHWGLPCIVSDRVGSHHDLVIEGKTGFLHPWNDPATLATRLEQLVHDPALLASMGHAARQHAEGYRCEVTAAKLLEAFARALSR
jgi:glycosyltransferase involved in cell wall biosynthesis